MRAFGSKQRGKAVNEAKCDSRATNVDQTSVRSGTDWKRIDRFQRRTSRRASDTNVCGEDRAFE